MKPEEIESLEPGVLLRIRYCVDLFKRLNSPCSPIKMFSGDIVMALEKPINTKNDIVFPFYSMKCLYKDVIGYCYITSYSFEVIS